MAIDGAYEILGYLYDRSECTENQLFNSFMGDYSPEEIAEIVAALQAIFFIEKVGTSTSGLPSFGL